MKKLLFPALVGLLAFMLLFPACDETEDDPTGPDSTDQLIGTWVRYSFEVEGETVVSPAIDIFRANGTGTAWYEDEESYTSQNYTWSLSGDTLTLELEHDGSHVVMIEFLSDNRIVFSHEADGGSWVDERVRLAEQIEQGMVGSWIMTAQTQDGTSIEPDNVRVTLNSDGTGTYTDPGGSSVFDWCAIEGFLVVLQSDNVGFVMTYTTGQESFVLTEIREDGIYTMTFTPYDPPDDVVEAFVGTWVREAIYIDESYADIDAAITFREDGTGSVIEEDQDSDEPLTFAFTWTATSTMLNMIEGTGEWETHASYTLQGNRASLSYDLEIDGMTYQAEDTFYKQTDEHPEEVVGTWVQEAPYIGDGYVEMEVTLVVDADGNLLIESRYYTQGEPWQDEQESWESSWSVSEDRMLIVDGETGLGMAYQFTVNGSEAVLSHPSMGTRNFLLNEGELPGEAIGTWVPYHLTLNNELQETMIMELRLHDDGTCAVSMLEYHEDGSETVQVDSMNWIARDNKVLMTMIGSSLCEVLEYSIEGEQMTINRHEFMEWEGRLDPMEIQFAKRSGELNPAAYGSWEKTGETLNGENSPDFDPASITLNEDGTGLYSDVEEDVDFTWSWTPGSPYVIHSYMVEGERVSQASPVTLADNTLVLTSYFEDEGHVITLVETFTRQ